jgi:hypothetical protein
MQRWLEGRFSLRIPNLVVGIIDAACVSGLGLLKIDTATRLQVSACEALRDQRCSAPRGSQGIDVWFLTAGARISGRSRRCAPLSISG